MTNPFCKGDRVEFEGFGEGTVIDIVTANEVEVAFSEDEMFTMSVEELVKL